MTIVPFCPKCKAEYYPGVRACADCDVPLVAALPRAARVRDLAREDSEAICEIDSVAEGAEIVADLERNGIGAMVANGQVRVLAGDVARALPLVEKHLVAATGQEGGAEEGRPAATDEDLVAVYEAPDQFLATTIESLLQHEGISAATQSRQMPMYDGLALMQHPSWGKVLVLKRDEARARAVVAAFLNADLGAEDQLPVCPSCGMELRRSARFCDRCGVRVPAHEETAPQ